MDGKGKVGLQPGGQQRSETGRSLRLPGQRLSRKPANMKRQSLSFKLRPPSIQPVTTRSVDWPKPT